MTAKKNAIAKDLRSPKYRLRVVKSKKAYVRRPKHPARAADAVSGQRVAECAIEARGECHEHGRDDHRQDGGADRG